MCHEVVDGAIHHAEGPIRVEKEDKVEGAIEQGHHQIRHGEIHQEVVGDGAHPLMSCNTHANEKEDKIHRLRDNYKIACAIISLEFLSRRSATAAKSPHASLKTRTLPCFFFFFLFTPILKF